MLCFWYKWWCSLYEFSLSLFHTLTNTNTTTTLQWPFTHNLFGWMNHYFHIVCVCVCCDDVALDLYSYSIKIHDKTDWHTQRWWWPRQLRDRERATRAKWILLNVRQQQQKTTNNPSQLWFLLQLSLPLFLLLLFLCSFTHIASETKIPWHFMRITGKTLPKANKQYTHTHTHTAITAERKQKSH